jgi:hypothetical protein
MKAARTASPTAPGAKRGGEDRRRLDHHPATGEEPVAVGRAHMVLRKAQEAVLALFMLEALLGKQRILEIYLNHVEWGEGVFGAQAAARHYFRVDAAQLTPDQAARLAVMLPAPKRFEQRPGSGYVVSRSSPPSSPAWRRGAALTARP